MTKILTLIVLTLAIVLGGCATPKQPGCDGPPPGLGVPPGVAQSNQPKTGTMPGAPGWTNVYGREKVDLHSTFKPKSGQAGSVNNNQGLGALTGSHASAPPGLKACASSLEVLNIQLASLEPGSDKWSAVATQINTLTETSQRVYGDWLEKAGLYLAPKIENVLVFNTAGVGSSNQGAHPITDKKVEAMAKGGKEAAGAATKGIVELKGAKPGSKTPEEIAAERAKAAEDADPKDETPDSPAPSAPGSEDAPEDAPPPADDPAPEEGGGS